MKGGHFRYHLDKVETKIIPGQKKYVAQVSSIEIPQKSTLLEAHLILCNAFSLWKFKNF